MTYPANTPNNPSLFNAAYSGALAGQMAGSGITGIPAVDDSTGPSVYAKASNIAYAFAWEFDQVAFTTPVTNVSTSGHATVIPSSAAIQGTQLAYEAIVLGLAFGMFFQRKGADVESDTGDLPADWATTAAAVAAQVTVAGTALSGAGTLT